MSVSLEHIPLLKHSGKAVEYACSLADLDPKQLCPDVFKDASACSRILSGERSLRFDEAWRLNKRTGNRALTYYFNHMDGVDIASMRLREDDSARRIRHLEGEVARRDDAIQFLVDAAHGRLHRQPDERDRVIAELQKELTALRLKMQGGGNRP